MKSEVLEKLLWSVAFPGFGQILNKKYLKGIVAIVLEMVINVNSKLNQAIIFSFHGDITQAINSTNFQWLLFYPCVYLFAMWDAYRDAGGGSAPFSYIPFVIAAYLGTLGVVFSTKLRIFGVLLGPVWLPLLFMIIGAGVSIALGVIFQNINNK